MGDAGSPVADVTSRAVGGARDRAALARVAISAPAGGPDDQTLVRFDPVGALPGQAPSVLDPELAGGASLSARSSTGRVLDSIERSDERQRRGFVCADLHLLSQSPARRAVAAGILPQLPPPEDQRGRRL